MDFGNLYNDIKNAVDSVVGGVQHALGINTAPQPPQQAPQAPTQAPAAPGQAPNPTLNLAQLTQAIGQGQQVQQDQQKNQQIQVPQINMPLETAKNELGNIAHNAVGMAGNIVNTFIPTGTAGETPQTAQAGYQAKTQQNKILPNKQVGAGNTPSNLGIAGGVALTTGVPVVGKALEVAAPAVLPALSRLGATDVGGLMRSSGEGAMERGGIPEAEKLATNPKTPTGTRPATQAIPEGAATGEPQVVPKVSSSAKPTTESPVSQFNQAVQNLHDFYNQSIGKQPGVEELVNKVNGGVQYGQRLAGQLKSAVARALPSSADRQTLTHILDGSVDPATVHPTIKAVADGLNGLNEHAFQVRQAADPEVGQVKQYATRVTQGVNRKLVSTPGGSGARGVINRLSQLSTSSRFNQARNVYKFVAKDGSSVVGDARKLGLTENPETGEWVDKQGNPYKIAPASIKEIEGANVARFQKDQAKVANVYHTDTTGLKAHADAINELKANPEQYGLEYHPDGVIPDEHEEINVNGLEDYSAPPEVAARLEKEFAPKRTGIIDRTLGRAWRGINNTATQFIVFNPTIHTANLLVQGAIQSGVMPLFKGGELQAGPIGALRAGASLTKFLTSSTAREQMIRDYLLDGGHSMTYGKNQQTIVSNLLDQAHLPHVNKLNSNAMSSIEMGIRASLHDANKAAGMSASKSVKTIDNFLGRKESQGAIARNLGMFWHWTETQGRGLFHTAKNPGALTNALLVTGLYFATVKAWQDFTGNSNATVTPRGELGLVKQGVQAGNELVHGQGTQLAGDVTSHINPGSQVLLNNIANKNIYTGQQFHGAGDRLANAGDTLFAPATNIEKGLSGQKSPLEIAANEEGFQTPHLKTTQAAPNIPAMNQPGAKADNAAYTQATAHYNNLSEAASKLSSFNQGVVQQYEARATDPNGVKYQEGPKQQLANAQTLANNDAVRQAVATASRKDPNHDPKWDLPDDKLKIVEKIESQAPGSGEREALIQNQTNAAGDNWYYDLSAQRSTWATQLNFTSNAPINPNDRPVKYPLSQAEGSLMAQSGQITDPTQKSQFYADHPELTTIENKYGQFVNQERAAQNLPPNPLSPPPTQIQQQELTEYAQVPKGGGSKGGNKYEAVYLQNHPDLESYFMQSSLNSLLRNASVIQAGGTSSKAMQGVLKSINSLGYDLVKNTDGSYSLNATGGNTGSGSSSKSSSSSSVGSYHPHFEVGRQKTINTKFKRPSTQMRFKVKYAKPPKRINQTEAPPIRIAKPQNSGIRTRNDTIKST